MAAGRHPQDAPLKHLVGELTVGSPAFAKLWATQYVHEKTHGTKTFDNELTGKISLRYETFIIPSPVDNQVLVIYTAAPNSTEQDLLDRLKKQVAAHQAEPTAASTTS